MIRGLYTSGWSMLANSRKMDVISNNLANVSTNAYKKDTVVFESFPDVLARRINQAGNQLSSASSIGHMELGSDVGEIYTYYRQGQLIKTENQFDIAFHGTDTAFFTVGVQDDNGNITEFYTRDGSFAVNEKGQLVTRDGYLVMGENGPITLGEGSFSVNNDGIIVQNNEVIDRLLVKDFENTGELRKYGSNLVQASEEAVEREFTGTVMQGYLEQSNVNAIREMVDMIAVMRSYEASQKLIQAQDSTLEKVVNEVGAVR